MDLNKCTCKISFPSPARRAYNAPTRPGTQVDGRIDDPQDSWKGKGLWMTSGNRTPAHIEGIDATSPGAHGKTLSSPLAVHFRLRPEPPAH